MIPQSKKYFAIIVHYGPPAVTHRAVESVLAAAKPPDHLAVVNNSRDPLILAPGVEVIPARQNLGYAGGINLALGVLTHRGMREQDVVIFMNNDLRLASDALVELRRWWQNHPAPALLGPSFLGQSITGPGQVNLLTGRTTLSAPTSSRVLSPGFFTLPYLHGAFVSTTAGILMRLKGLPESYFMYWEDVLFSRQAALLKIPLCFEPRIRVFHEETKSPDASHQYYLVRNGAVFLQNETPLPWRLYWRLLNPLRLAYHSLPGRLPPVQEALRDAIRQVNGPRA